MLVKQIVTRVCMIVDVQYQKHLNIFEHISYIVI